MIVHTWCVNLDVPPEKAAALSATLSPDERDRSARLRFARDRQRFIVTRGVLRTLLGRYLDLPPGDVRFAYNACGKPELDPNLGSRLQFNVSRSADLALIAITTRARIGVDLERIQPQPDGPAIARSVFAPAEVDELSRTPSGVYDAAFLSCWTKKEAYVKARGESLADASGCSDESERWSLYQLNPAPGYVASLVVEVLGLDLRKPPRSGQNEQGPHGHEHGEVCRDAEVRASDQHAAHAVDAVGQGIDACECREHLG